ncbi:hypothetical protein [Zavarzinia sp.]|uniref:hypothetical protein n=1 Tax=Zavarzinia sp. TaxID=2027920 RepID=UPI0035656BA4
MAARQLTVVFPVVAALALSACAQRLGAPGQAPPLDTMQMTGTAKPVAQCTMEALTAAGTCADIDYKLGLSTNDVTGAVSLTCYNITPAAASAGAMFGLVGVLVGYAVGTEAPADETNKRPPRFTTVLQQTKPDALDVSFWVHTSVSGPESSIADIKTALKTCEGKGLTVAAPAPAAPAPGASPAPAAASAPVKPAS